MTLTSKFEDVYRIHIGRLYLKNVVTKPHPSFVVFSAIPGSGKSEISRRLASDYDYLRITNKLIRESISESGHEDIVIGDYTIWFLNKLNETLRPNIVFDRNIDQWYESSRKWANENHYQYFLVAINVSLKDLSARLFIREGTMDSKAHQMLSFYNKQHVGIQKFIEVTISLEGDYDLDTAAKSISNLGI